MFKFENLNWKVFIVSFLPVFIFSVLQHLHLAPTTLRSFNLQPAKVKIIDEINIKLQQNKNLFNLSSPTFITPTLAASDYDKAKAYIVLNFDSGEVITQKDSTQRAPIASLTKLMTAVVALDLNSKDTSFTVSPIAQDVEPTRMGVKVGEKLTLEELLNALLMTSANDAAQVIKDGVDQHYTQGSFVGAMNEKAQFIGLKNTHFTNPQGFDDSQHYSSASDLAILTHYALENYPLINQIVRKDYQFLPANSSHPQFDLYNWNGLLGVYPGVMGVKIGNTDAAGKTTIVLSERNGKRILTVLLGAPGIIERDLWASELLNQGFAKYNIASADITEQQLKNKYSTWKYWN